MKGREEEVRKDKIVIEMDEKDREGENECG